MLCDGCIVIIIDLMYECLYDYYQIFDIVVNVKGSGKKNVYSMTAMCYYTPDIYAKYWS